MNTNNVNDANGPNRPLDPNGKDASIGRENFGCDAFAEELSLFVFGETAELTDERRAALERHLVSCAACRSERDALQRSLELLKSESARGAAPQLSAERQANLLAQASAQAAATVAAGSGATPGRHILNLRPWLVAAGLLVMSGAVWFVNQTRRSVDHCEDSVQLASRSRFDPSDGAASRAPQAKRFEDAKIRVEPERRSLGQPEGVPSSDSYSSSSPEAKAQPPTDPALLPDVKTAPAHDEHVAELEQLEAKSKKLEAKVALGENEDLLDLAKVETRRVKHPAEPAGPAGPMNGAPPVPVRGGDSKSASGDPSAPTAAPAGGATKGAPARSQGGYRERGLARQQPKTTPDVATPLSSSSGQSAAMPPSNAGRDTGTDVPNLSSGAPSTKGDASYSFSSRQQIGNYLYETPDSAGNTATTYEMALLWARQDDFSWMGGDESSEDARTTLLRSLGYVVEDAGGGDGNAAPRAPLDPALVGRILAAACSPSDVLRFQAHVAAALGIDPAAPGADVEKDRDTIVREFLDRLSPRQNEPPRDMFFRYFGDNPFVSTRIDCKSTFGMDVDTASYALARAYLSKGVLPPKAAVRTEEFVNAFKHDLAPPNSRTQKDGRADDHDGLGDPKSPAGADVFAIHTEVAPSPFGDDRQLLLQVGLKARVIPKSQRKPVALTFIIDVSGSMSQGGRLELVKRGLHLLVNQLDERDTIGIVSFETTAHRILDPTNAANRGRIFGALDTLRPEGSTNVDEGLRFGYDMALEQLRPAAENRVILCSDGVANTGVTDPKVLSARIAECKSKYVYLNCVGVGMGNHNDALMEQLADQGDGFCAYLDRLEEAKKIFVERLTGTLMTVARNAKIQLEFDPASVRSFRQLGYEKRALAHRDFRNDKVDAGEVGAGQEVVALYEIEPRADAAGPLATVRIRYEDPDHGEVREQARQVFVAEVAPTLAKTTPRFRLSACVAEFAEILRQSVHARDGSFGAVVRLAEPLVDELKGDADVPEFVALVEQAARLPDLLPRRDELVRCVDELKRLRWMREEYRDTKSDADEALMRRLEEQNRELERQLRDALDRALRHS